MLQWDTTINTIPQPKYNYHMIHNTNMNFFLGCSSSLSCSNGGEYHHNTCSCQCEKNWFGGTCSGMIHSLPGGGRRGRDSGEGERGLSSLLGRDNGAEYHHNTCSCQSEQDWLEPFLFWGGKTGKGERKVHLLTPVLMENNTITIPVTVCVILP